MQTRNRFQAAAGWNDLLYLSSIKGYFCANGIKVACDSGYFCGGEGLAIQSECKAGYECPNSLLQEYCNPGYFSEAKATVCTPCPPGTKASFFQIFFYLHKEEWIWNLSKVWKSFYKFAREVYRRVRMFKSSASNDMLSLGFIIFLVGIFIR